MRNIIVAAYFAFVASLATPGSVFAADQKPSDFSGEVLETTNAGGYTYVQIDTGKEKVWAAAPFFQVKPGDKVSFKNGMAMPNYESKSLHRKFDTVYFTERVMVNDAMPLMSLQGSGTNTGGQVQLPKGHPEIGATAAPELPKGHPDIGTVTGKQELPQGHPPLTGGPSKSTVDLKGIKKAEGGYTVEEICRDAAKLAGKEVKVRAKVVKFNAMIMGKNWLHLRDGTGAEGKNDLLLTTSTKAKVGDTVLATGKVSVDKDFGANYKYPVMIEDGTAKVE